MDEVRTRDIEAVEVNALEECELLEHHRPLRPRSGLANRITAIWVRERPLDGRLPARHVLPGQHAAVALPAGIHDLLAAAEAIDRPGDNSPPPHVTCAPGFL